VLLIQAYVLPKASYILFSIQLTNNIIIL
jgi:hypothetical protein